MAKKNQWELDRGRETPAQKEMIERHAESNRRLRKGEPGTADDILRIKRENLVIRKPKDAI